MIIKYLLNISKLLCQILAHIKFTMYLCYVNKTIRVMNKKDEILALSQKLTELKLRLKMVSWTFYNSKDLPESKANAILDEKIRIEKFVEALEKRLKELDN